MCKGGADWIKHCAALDAEGHLRKSCQNAVKEDVKSWSVQRECTGLKQVKKRNPGVTAVA